VRCKINIGIPGYLTCSLVGLLVNICLFSIVVDVPCLRELCSLASSSSLFV
jgi:hypothetical protein